MDLNGPALAPPAGITSNLDNPPNNNALAIGVFSTCAAIATICFLMRAYARIFLLKKVQIEEGLILCAYGCYWGAVSSLLRLIETPGYFVHTWNVRVRDLIPTQYYVFLFGVFYSVVLASLKVSICVEWCRLFAPLGRQTQGYFWWSAVVVICIQIANGIATVVALNLQCIPQRAIWDITITATSKCFDLYKLQVASASIQLISDVLILLLPQGVIWGLKMTWQKRLGISIIFALGLLACICAAFRLSTTITHGNSADSIYTLGPLAFWATAEMTCAFFVVSLPCIPKIIKESRGTRNLMKALGIFSSGVSYDQSHKSNTGLNSTNHSRLGSTSANAYYKLDHLKSSESTEHLHKDGGGPDLKITRTTKFMITEDTSEDFSRNKSVYP